MMSESPLDEEENGSGDSKKLLKMPVLIQNF